MIYYFVQKNIDHTAYLNAKKNERSGWRSAMLTDLHALDRITVDVHVTFEGGTTLANNLNIHSYMNW